MKCSGCGACAIICPKHCIKMLNNEEGFLRPVINKDKCVNCNLCKKVCIYNNCEVNGLIRLESFLEDGDYMKMDSLQQNL